MFLVISIFVSLIKETYVSSCWLVTFYCLKMVPRIKNNSKFTKEQEMFAQWTIDGV